MSKQPEGSASPKLSKPKTWDAGTIGLLLAVVAIALGFIGLIFGNSFAAASITAIAILMGTTSLFSGFFGSAKSADQTTRALEEIRERAEQAPEKSKFAWDLAQATLEAYFNRNLSQVANIFRVAVGVMVVGFAFIMWGVTLAVKEPALVKTSYIAAASGIITEFIGVTFMVIYRSTMAQANQFMTVLERINTVGMAVQILDAIPESNAELKNSTRAEIVSLLLAVSPRKAADENRRRAKS
jgi:TRADD-N domain-containing protein